jgi:C1A family cysteine protease
MAKIKKVTPRDNKRYGWTPDHPDQRDLMFAFNADDAARYAGPYDLRAHVPPHDDQGQLGSCTAHGGSHAYRTMLLTEGFPDVHLSRLGLYYDTRAVEGTTRSDSGAQIRDVIKVLAKTGIGPESDWPYDITQFAKKPPKNYYTDAKKDLAVQYERVAVSSLGIRAALAEGLPVIIGISVYESFESDDVAKTGVVPMPGNNEQLLGGHCMLVVGYGQKPGYFTVHNSWGDGWGDKGDCYIPEAYLGNPNLGEDYWVLKKVMKVAA